MTIAKHVALAAAYAVCVYVAYQLIAGRVF